MDWLTSACSILFGGGVACEGESLAIDFPLEGYAFLAFDR
jgi:hypothetical protein